MDSEIASKFKRSTFDKPAGKSEGRRFRYSFGPGWSRVT